MYDDKTTMRHIHVVVLLLAEEQEQDDELVVASLYFVYEKEDLVTF